MMIRRSSVPALLAICLLAIVGCGTTYPTFRETSLHDYRRGNINWSDGEVTRLFTKVLPRNGHLAFCAYAVSGFRAGDGDAEARMLKTNSFYVGEHRIGSGSFIPVFGPGDIAGRHAECVETDVAWEPAMARAPLEMKGASRFVMKY